MNGQGSRRMRREGWSKTISILEVLRIMVNEPDSIS
jgi:hypothetical protein